MSEAAKWPVWSQLQHEFVFRGPERVLWPDPRRPRGRLQVPDRPGWAELHVPLWPAPAQAPPEWHQLRHARLPLQGLLPLQLTHRLSSLQVRVVVGVRFEAFRSYQEIDTKLDMDFESILAKNLVSVSWYAWLTEKTAKNFTFLCECKKWRTQCVAPCVYSAVRGRWTIREKLSH